MIKVTSDKTNDETNLDEYPMLLEDECLGLVIYAIREN